MWPSQSVSDYGKGKSGELYSKARSGHLEEFPLVEARVSGEYMAPIIICLKDRCPTKKLDDIAAYTSKIDVSPLLAIIEKYGLHEKIVELVDISYTLVC